MCSIVLFFWCGIWLCILCSIGSYLYGGNKAESPTSYIYISYIVPASIYMFLKDMYTFFRFDVIRIN